MPLDTLTPIGATLALLPELLLCGGALVVLLVAGWRHHTEADSRLAGYLSLASIAVSSIALVWLWRTVAAPTGPSPMVALDGFRFAAAGLFLFAAAFTITVSLAYVAREQMLAPEYHVLILFATAGLMFLGGASDLIVLFLGLEVMSVAVYVLAGFNRRSRPAAEAALKYFLIGSFAAGFVLYGIALLYGATGQTNLALIGQRVASGTTPPMLALGIGMLVIGFGFKVAAVPFHMWAPDTYDGAPTPVTGYMATGVKAAGFVALLRLTMEAFPGAITRWQPALGIIAVVTILVGSVVALNQRSLKRMLAYSSIVHAGYLLVGVWSGTRAGAAAVLVHLAAYSLTTLATFAIIANLGRDGERAVTLDDLAGLSQRAPGTAFALAVCMLSQLGLPGTVGFMGKWLLITSALAEGQWILPTTLVVGTVLSAGYYLPVIMAAYMRPAPAVGPEQAGGLPRLTALAVGGSVLAILALGVWPAPTIDTATASAASIRQPAPPAYGPAEAP